MEKKSCDIFGQCCKGEQSFDNGGSYYEDRDLAHSNLDNLSSMSPTPNANGNYAGYFVGADGTVQMSHPNGHVRHEEYHYYDNEGQLHREGQTYQGDEAAHYDAYFAQHAEMQQQQQQQQQYEERQEDVTYGNYQYSGSQEETGGLPPQMYEGNMYRTQNMEMRAAGASESGRVYSQFSRCQGSESGVSKERPVINVKGDQPVFTVPVYQDKYLRDKIIEVPQYEVQDVVQPKVFTQETKHDIPTVELIYREKPIHISQPKIVEKPVEVDVPIGYTPLYAPKWDVREVPRPVPKYQGDQKIIEVEVPQIKYVDRFVEKEIVVDVKEKIIPKITEVEKAVDVVRYEWKEQYQDVPVYKYVPKIDVELECPPPLIVPYPEPHFQNTAHVVNPHQTAADIPPEILMKNVNISKVSNAHVNEQMKKSLLEIARSTPQKTKGTQKKATKRWSFWPCKSCTEEKEDENDVDPETGYPKAMPRDFAHFFKKDLNTVKKQMQPTADSRSNLSAANAQLENTPVHPTIEYLGKIDKAPIDGGKLDAISFKLHAIEVHQFIPVPSLPKPKFLDMIPPEKIEQNDISCLENVFGSVPEGWVDPNITGYIAPMMNDVLQGNIKPENPLFNKISLAGSKLNLKPFPSLIQQSPSNANMSQANLSHANMSNANMSNANMSQANLSKEYMSNGNMSNANMSKEFRGSNAEYVMEKSSSNNSVAYQ